MLKSICAIPTVSLKSHCRICAYKASMSPRDSTGGMHLIITTQHMDAKHAVSKLNINSNNTLTYEAAIF